jgi:NIMA (never in mitosis gene a)-related kinase 1/4/5
VCRDRNIIAYKEAFFDEPSSALCIVMEYADGGDLYRKIVEHKK